VPTLQPLFMSALCCVSKVPRCTSLIAGLFPALTCSRALLWMLVKDRDWCCAVQELMTELHNTLAASSSAGREYADDSEDDDHEVTDPLDRSVRADRPAPELYTGAGARGEEQEDDEEEGEDEEEEDKEEEEEEEGADARKSERDS